MPETDEQIRAIITPPKVVRKKLIFPWIFFIKMVQKAMDIIKTATFEGRLISPFENGIDCEKTK